MIKFNELRISADWKLHLDAQVRDESYFDNVYIDKIIIDNQDTFTISGPSSTPIFSYTFSKGTKTVSFALDSSDLMFHTSDVLFVYITTTGTPSPDTPCGMDNAVTMAIAYYEGTIYHSYLGYIKEIGNNCVVPRGFIDYYFKVQAFKLALEIGNYTEAIRIWNKFFKSQSTVITSSGKCSCNGTS